MEQNEIKASLYDAQKAYNTMYTGLERSRARITELEEQISKYKLIAKGTSAEIIAYNKFMEENYKVLSNSMLEELDAITMDNSQHRVDAILRQKELEDDLEEEFEYFTTLTYNYLISKKILMQLESQLH